jgi:2-iminobutanoate/2-iminopropanoate deaminase
VDPGTLGVVAEGFQKQAEAVMRDVGAVLDAGDSDWSHVLRVGCFLANAADFPTWNRIWCERFAPPRPARTTVVCSFTVPGMLIELEVVAAVKGANG